MKYAVPVTGGILSPHFGHCEQFALIDVDEKSRKVIKKQMVPSPEHQPGLLPGWLAQQGVQFIIAGGMGSRAQELFLGKGIHVVTGASQEAPEKVVSDYLAGILKTGANVCDH